MKKYLWILLFNFCSALLNAQEWQGVTPGDIYYDQGKVGIGTSSPQSPLHVNGTFLLTHPSFAGSLEIRHLSNNQILFTNSGIGSFLRIGPGNTIDLDGQLLQSTGRGAILSGTISGNALETLVGKVLLNKTSGNMIIGNSTDNGNKLQVNGNIWATGLALPTGAGAGKVLTSDASGTATWQTAAAAGWSYNGDQVGALKNFGTTDNYALPFITNNMERMRIDEDGNIGIGISSPQAKLAVNGDIFSKKVKVTQSGWPDYVFYSSYELPSLPEIEAYILKYRHLPEIPSAGEIEEKGLDLGNTQAALLKKVEELTLYIIEQNKQFKDLQNQLQEVKEQLKEINQSKLKDL